MWTKKQTKSTLIFSGSAFFQTVFFLPSVICGVAVGLTWTFIYNGNYGLLNAFLKFIGLGGLSQVWLANKDLAMFKSILKVDAVLSITGSLKYYDLVAVMTSGGQNHATEVMSTCMYYQAFNVLKYGYASAIGVILMVLCVMSVGISNTVFRTENDM